MSLSASNHSFIPNSSVRVDVSTGLISLTDMWQERGALVQQRPQAWVRFEQTQNFLKQLAYEKRLEPTWSDANSAQGMLVRQVPTVLEITEENGTFIVWANREVAVSYARFLGEDTYQWALTYIGDDFQAEKAWEQQISERKNQQKQKVWTRRAVIAAGWAVPVVTTIALSQKVRGQTPGVDQPAPQPTNGGGATPTPTPTVILTDGRVIQVQ